MAESAAAKRLREEGLDPALWSNGPGDRYASHRHEYDKVIVVERGSIAFGVEGETVQLSAGDRLELPAGTEHDAIVGPDGVVCLEAHLPVGALGRSGARRVSSAAWSATDVQTAR
ncbi:MAG TPA: cupin domain-containing protein [Candidatus Limnocylindrales bacterium]|nr:cupin domain-containing protein [Candidatus Limnocylindrales bacterium]